MNILSPLHIGEALSWLSTDAFDSLQMPALAVVLGAPGQEDLLRHLETECGKIDGASDSILILSLGTSHDSPGIYNPRWRYRTDSGLARQIEAFGRMRGYHFGTCWGSFPEAAIRLLNLEMSCLPAIYLRFAGSGRDRHRSPAIVVPLPQERPELASRFLTRLSWAADDHAHGHDALDHFLQEQGLSGWVIPEGTQEALDQAMRNNSPGRHYSGLNPDESEQGRIRIALSVAMADATMGWGGMRRQSVSEIEQFLNPRIDPPGCAFQRPDLMVALRLAEVAHKMGDYGTVVRNIGAAVESLFSATLLHLVRGSRKVRLPDFLDHVDPVVGKVDVAGVDLNRPRLDRIGATCDINTGIRDPWLAPPHGKGLQALELWIQEQDPGVPGDQFAAIVNLHSKIVTLRNPAAHGELITQRSADEMWLLLEELILSGQAAAMSSVRRSFRWWPRLDLTFISSVRSDPRPHYEQALQIEHQAREASKTSGLKRKESEETLIRLRTTHGYLCSLAEKPNLEPQDLASCPDLKSFTKHLEGWQAFQEDVAALIDGDSRTGSMARSAARWFTTTSVADRHHLALVSKAITPDPHGVRCAGDFDMVIARIEQILALGTIVPRPGVDWQLEVRRGLERWLESVGLSKLALERLPPSALHEKIRAWAGTLAGLLRESEVRLKAADLEHAEALKVLGCAVKRLGDARSGHELSCVCGQHGRP